MNAPFVAEGTTVRYNWLHPTLLGTSMHYSQAMHKPDFCIKWHHFVHSSRLSFVCACVRLAVFRCKIYKEQQF